MSDAQTRRIKPIGNYLRKISIASSRRGKLGAAAFLNLIQKIPVVSYIRPGIQFSHQHYTNYHLFDHIKKLNYFNNGVLRISGQRLQQTFG